MKRVILSYQDSRGWKYTVKEAADERAFSMKVPLEAVEDAADVVEAVEAIFKNMEE